MSESSGAIRERLTTLQNRSREIASEISDLEQDLEEERRGLGTVVARGGPADERRALQSAIRDLTEELEGHRRAQPVLQAEIDAAESDLETALRSEADHKAEAKLALAIETVDALHEGLLAAWDGSILPLAERAETALAESASAERESGQLKGQRSTGEPAAIRQGWRLHPGLQNVLRECRIYRAGGREEFQMAQKRRDRVTRTAFSHGPPV